MTEKIYICGSSKEEETGIYIRKDNGIYVREAHIKGVKKGAQPVRILHISDVHFNYANDADKDDEEIMETIKYRKWNENGASVKAAVKVMDYAKNFDQTVITGDVLDYLSKGAMELMDKYIWDRDENVIVSLGGHELTKEMQTGREDKLSIEEIYKIIENYWRHDCRYLSRVIKDSVMVIQLDNACHKYWQSQVKMLEDDIKKAKEENLTVLIFQHEPISTGKIEDKMLKAVRVHDGEYKNFFDCVVGGEPDTDEATEKVYNLITRNADVVKGIFCGHFHSCYYAPVNACFTDENGSIHRVEIPQYVLEATVYDDYAGHVIEITVE